VARRFFEEKLLPSITSDYRNKHFDKQIMKELGKMGFLGCTLDGYGGSGLNYVSYGLINREIE
jgi:glutaryl-CoA dehydrogenase